MSTNGENTPFANKMHNSFKIDEVIGSLSLVTLHCDFLISRSMIGKRIAFSKGS
jgi:hypothetical protein